MLAVKQLLYAAVRDVVIINIRAGNRLSGIIAELQHEIVILGLRRDLGFYILRCPETCVDAVDRGSLIKNRLELLRVVHVSIDAKRSQRPAHRDQPDHQFLRARLHFLCCGLLRFCGFCCCFLLQLYFLRLHGGLTSINYLFSQGQRPVAAIAFNAQLPR